MSHSITVSISKLLVYADTLAHGTYEGNDKNNSDGSARISMIYGSQKFETYQNDNASITIDEFDPDTGLSGSFAVAGGILIDVGIAGIEDSKSITIDPNGFEFKCTRNQK